MLTLYRGMKESTDGKPECGSTGRTLGVRVPGDIKPDAEGRVHPGEGGMSCAPDEPMRLLPHRRPRALLGTSPDSVFALPVPELGEPLSARQDSPTHVVVEPAASTELPFYIAALHATRPRWTKIA